MRTTAIRLLLAITVVVMGACGTGEDTEAGPSAGVSPGSGPSSAADKPAAAPDLPGSEPSVNGASLQVSRTREGNGGIIAVAGEMTMEFDYSPPQGHCKASDGKFEARGIGINDDQAGVSIDSATIVAPDTGRIVGQVFFLEVRKDGYVPWAASSGRSGTVENITQDIALGGGVTLNVTGLISGFKENRATTGTRVPFRLEVTCEPK